MANMLEQNNNLKVLTFHWNKITGKGGIYIAKAMNNNKYLLVLDGSYNALGSSLDSASAKAFSQMFKTNSFLLHLDLSHNGFNEIDCQILSKGLNENHTILGIHLQGNDTSVDSKGFLRVGKNNNPSYSHVISRISNRLEFGTKTMKELVKMKVYNNCWICEGWTEMKFTFNYKSFNYFDFKEGDQVYIHFNFDSFEPEEMIPDENVIFTILRMVPPGDLKYFYSINKEIILYDPKKEVIEIKDRDFDFIKSLPVHYIPKTNIIRDIIQKKGEFSESIIDKLLCIPRPNQKIQVRNRRIKTPWSFNNSIFKQYKHDTDQMLLKCFQYDWDHSKLKDPKFIKSNDERNKVKEIIWKYYKSIREIYKFYAAIEPSGRIFSISENVTLDLLNKSDILDNNNLTVALAQIDFIQTNSNSETKDLELNPERFITRPELSELLTRLGLRKYKKSDGYSISKGVELLFQQFTKCFPSLDCHIWRVSRFWNEDCDIILKKYRALLELLYKKFSGRETLPGNKKFVCRDEFFELVTASGLVDENFGLREISIIFNQSMMTNIEELHSDRHLNMFFDEFIEAISRVADRVGHKSQFEKNLISLEVSESLPLPTKIKTFLDILMKKCLNRDEFETLERQIQDPKKVK